MNAFILGFKAIAKAFVDFFSGLPDFWAVLKQFIRAIIRFFRGIGGDRKRGGSCIKVSPAALKRADPLIYSQYYLMKMGLAITWDNPDIQLYKSGVPVSPSDLQSATDYEVRVRVWNGSYDAPAINLPVFLSFLSFGIGTSSTAVGSDSIDLDPKGGPLEPAFASIPWRTPPLPGHYCLQARLVWPDDANPDNNLGQKNTQVGQAHSPAVFEIAVHNDAVIARDFDFEVDTYTPLPRPPCPPPRTDPRAVSATAKAGRFAESTTRWREALRTQGYGRFPLPDGWHIDFDPARPHLEPGEQIPVKVTVNPPPSFVTGQQPINVHGFARSPQRARTLAGGVTLIVEKS